MLPRDKFIEIMDSIFSKASAAEREAIIFQVCVLYIYSMILKRNYVSSVDVV